MKKFKNVLKKEFLIYLITLLILIVIAHSDILGDPLARFDRMAQSGNYIHPFYWSIAIYSVLFILRKLIDLLAKLFEKKQQ